MIVYEKCGNCDNGTIWEWTFNCVGTYPPASFEPIECKKCKDGWIEKEI